MAQGVDFVCNHCRHRVEAWSGGQPYYFDENGAKHYAHHPTYQGTPPLVGNDEPHLCLNCGEEFDVDSEAPLRACPACGDARMIATYALDGSPCPRCKEGVFAIDAKSYKIS